MREFYLGSVEHEPFGGLAVQIVAHNGAVEARVVRCVNAQLVRAASLGKEFNQCAPIGTTDDRKTRCGWLAVLKIYHLPRTVVDVGAERQAHGAAVGWQKAVEQGHVALFHPPKGEQHLHGFENPLGFGNEQNARGVHVEAVHH